MPRPSAPDRLGAHVSSQGGVARAPERARAIGATAIQLFTKTPNQWREPAISAETAREFERALVRHGITAAVSHDSYLINLASPDPALRARSMASFVAELARAERLGLAYVVSHPGNFLDDRRCGLARNAQAYAEGLAAVPGRVRVALETTAGSGTALGSTFEELAELAGRMPPRLEARVAFCADTCHLLAAGYDLVNDFDGVWRAFDRLLGLDRLAVLHLNDSKGALGSRRDRHALIGDGELGPEPFRRIMTDPRFRGVIKVIETPKGEDGVANDRRMLRRLRAYARGRLPAPGTLRPGG
ncbi:MAG: deoxyribonuclease IV [Gemmatimonadetes bacterium]|nr:deoxyribonuclease IV [Gemmatimonadota bacterium]